ncbi:Sialin [Chionoecetes opilio]|uniref:Sialin n=1 Tax=Chionoecetes opilio TaxID=41210 RepID=A0A8J5C099_CHIOP|nr:Sialin [Chionoecetes opilio]
MPFVHVHHCPSPSTTVSPAVIAIAGATAARASNDDVDTECSIWCSCCGYLRYLLVFLALLGCGIENMLRFNISVAIVAMVNNSVANDGIHVNSSYACPAARNASRDAQGTTGAGEYNWTAQEQSLVLGTFFWGSAITKTVGGRIAELLGATFTVAITVGLCGALTLLTPTVADIHPLALAALRFVFGMLQGPIQPAIYSILSRWALPGERATMISVAFSGSCLGSLVSLGLSGAVIKAYGWRWVFWGYGILTMLWVPFWAIYVKDSPRQHPAISSRELRQLSKNRNQPRERFLECFF